MSIKTCVIVVSAFSHPLALPRDMPEPLTALPLVPRTDGIPPLPLVAPPRAVFDPLAPLAADPPLAARTGVAAAVGLVNLLAGLVDAGGFSTKLVSVVLSNISDPIISAVPRSPFQSPSPSRTYRKVASTSRPLPPPSPVSVANVTC